MSTTLEAAGVAITYLRAQLAGEPAPEWNTPEFDRISDALLTLGNRASGADIACIGGSALALLIEAWRARLGAERAAAMAQLAAAQGKAPGAGGGR